MFAALLIYRGIGLDEAVTRAATVARDDQRAFLAGLEAGLTVIDNGRRWALGKAGGERESAGDPP